MQVMDIVVPSGRGRTRGWRRTEGTVTKVTGDSVFVQWHGTCVEDQLSPSEVTATGRTAKLLPSGVKRLRKKGS